MKTILKYFKNTARFLIELYIMFKWRRRRIKIKSDFPSYNEIKSLGENGAVKINHNFSEFADYLFYHYTDRILNNKKLEHDIYSADNDIYSVNDGDEIILQVRLSLNDEKVVDFILNDKIYEILYGYFGQKYFLRDQPTLQTIISPKDYNASGMFHNDRFHQ